MHLERDTGSTWEANKLMMSLMKLSPDLSSPDFITPLASCQPICADQATRMALLKSMPTLDDIDIASVQRGDWSHDVVIPRAVALVTKAVELPVFRVAPSSATGSAALSVATTVKLLVAWVVRVPLQPLVRARRSRRGSSLMMMRCRPMRTFYCRGGYGYIAA
jgi:hypothetical protein